MDHGKMIGMNGTAPSPTTAAMQPRKKMMMMMHMTFFWGKDTEILFAGWPGKNKPAMYVVSLFFVFFLSVLVEWLAHSKLVKHCTDNNVAGGLIQTVMHCLRMGLAYLVMIAVMSFNGGVFIAALLGHSFGFFLFGSRVFENGRFDEKKPDLPPMSC